MAFDRTWIKPLARGGYSSRGLIYLIISLFAFLAAFGRSPTKDTEGALLELLQQPFGRLMLWLLVAGLCGYVLWRLVQSLFDTDDHGFSITGLGVRAGLLASAMTYSALAIFALAHLGLGGSGDGSNRVMDFFDGMIGRRQVIIAFGVVFLVVACAHIWKAVTRKYEKHFRADDDLMRVIHPVSMIGLTARGLVFMLLSGLSFYRAWNFEKHSEKPGLKDALAFVQNLPFGDWLLAATGVGLLLFATYSLMEARWRRINVEDA